MGHSSRKKKKHNKGRTPLKKDHSSGRNSANDNELLSKEITALSAIFQEDCKIEAVRGSLAQISIKLKPYSKDMGFQDDVQKLLSLLHDQVGTN